jgi:hypothetical protein
MDAPTPNVASTVATISQGLTAFPGRPFLAAKDHTNHEPHIRSIVRSAVQASGDQHVTHRAVTGQPKAAVA